MANVYIDFDKFAMFHVKKEISNETEEQSLENLHCLSATKRVLYYVWQRNKIAYSNNRLFKWNIVIRYLFLQHIFILKFIARGQKNALVS